MAVYSMMFMGMAPLGAILAGAAADRIGAPTTVAVGGAISIAAAIVFARHLPKIHAEARQLIDTAGVEASETVDEITAHAS